MKLTSGVSFALDRVVGPVRRTDANDAAWAELICVRPSPSTVTASSPSFLSAGGNFPISGRKGSSAKAASGIAEISPNQRRIRMRSRKLDFQQIQGSHQILLGNRKILLASLNLLERMFTDLDSKLNIDHLVAVSFDGVGRVLLLQISCRCLQRRTGIDRRQRLGYALDNFTVNLLRMNRPQLVGHPI